MTAAACPTLPGLRTARLTLRPVDVADLDDLLAVNGDPAVTRHLPYATWQNADDAQAWLVRMRALEAAGTASQCVLELAAGPRVVGTLLLFRHEAGSRRAEIGYALARRHWGAGLMREALAAACTHLFAVAGLRRLEAEVDPGNAASCRLLEALGFVAEGRLRRRWEAKGVAYDTTFYGLLREDWDGGLRAGRA